MPDQPPYPFDVEIQLEGCGMGMPVIRTWQALIKLPIGGIVRTSSYHP